MAEINDLRALLSEVQSALKKMTDGIDALPEIDFELEHAEDKLWRARRIKDKQLEVLTVAKAIDIATDIKWKMTDIFTINCETLYIWQQESLLFHLVPFVACTFVIV